MAASRRLARTLPSLISKHHRITAAEIPEPLETPQNPTSIPLDPSLPLLPLAVSHLHPPTPLPSLPSPLAASPSSLLLLLRRLRHHPRLAALDLYLLLAAVAASPSFRPDHQLTSLLAFRLATSRHVPFLRILLDFLISRRCHCSDASSIFSCPALLPTFRSTLLAFTASGDIPSASHTLASLCRAADSPLPAEFYNIVLPALQFAFAMKLTCLATGSGSYHSPASHLLELDGFRLLLDCPLDLSALAAFFPIPRTADSDDTGGLIRAPPYYKCPAAAAAARGGGVDAVLVSSATGLLGLPFLTRLPRFTRTKVYVTEVAARIGRLMMEELVEMHREFVRYYGLDTSPGPPKWMEGEELKRIPSVLWNISIGDQGDEVSALMPLYSAADIEECMQKIQPVKYGEEICFNGMLMLKSCSSGLELGSCIWAIRSPRTSITYLPSSIFVSAHALDFDYSSLKGNDLILFSDFSSLNDMDDDNENTGGANPSEMDEKDASLYHDSVLREKGVEKDENIKYLCDKDDIVEEIDKITFICSCIMDSIKSGGSVLIPIGRLGVIFLLLEHISETLASLSMKVPIFMISGMAEEIATFTSAIPEWLCKSRQEKLFSGEALFGHVELLKEGRLYLLPDLCSKGLLTVWAEPCIVFCPHWSLRTGPAVHLLHRWHADKRCLLVLEQGIDAELTLKPFKPVAIQVLECSFLSGMKLRKIHPLLGVLQPKLVLFPEDLVSVSPVKEDRSWSFLYYSEGKTIQVPNLREEFEVRLSTNVAFQLQPRQLDRNIAVARLKAKLLLSNGQYLLAAAKKHSTEYMLHWGTVDPSRLLTALREKGIICSIDSTTDSACCSILVTSPGEALVKTSSSQTTIYCDDGKTTKHIYDALSNICDGI